MTKLGRLMTIVLWVLLVVSAVLVVSLMVNINTENDADPTMLGWIDTNLVWAYILVALGAGIAVIFSLMHTFTDAAAAKQGLISLVFMVVVFGIAYVLASDAIPTFVGVEKYIADGTLTPKVSKLVGTGLYATYIMLFLAILGIAGSSVTRLFK